MAVARLDELTSPALARLVAAGRTPVALLPLGAIEPHGPHAPLATDVLIATGVCDRAAQALADDATIVPLVLPAIPFGVTRYAASFPGAVGIGEATLRALLLDVGRALQRDGIERIALVNHHFEPEQVATLRAAADELRAEGIRATLLDLTRRSVAARLTDEFRSGSCHAGRYETSLVLRDRPDLVDEPARERLARLDVDMPAEIAAGNTDFPSMGMTAAYCGAPAAATAAEGERSFAVLAGLLADLIRDLCSET